MRFIPLTKGKSVIVDDTDYESMSKFKWYAHEAARGEFYAARRKRGCNSFVYMHRVIVGSIFENPDELNYVDHVNGNTLDNRRSNLRNVSSRQNQQNMKKPSNNSSGTKGVSFHKAANKFRAYITVASVQKHLGLFNTKEEAIAARESAARVIFGDFAREGSP